MKPSLVSALCLALSVGLLASSGWCQSPDAGSATVPSSESDSNLYEASKSPLLYRANLKVDLGDPQQNVDQSRVFAYQVEQTDPETLQISCEGSTLPNKNSRSLGYLHRDEFFRIGPLQLPIRRMARSTITANGKTIKAPYSSWLCGLPIDLGRIPFPELRTQTRWKVQMPVTVGYRIQYANFLQIIPVSTTEQPNRNPYGRPGAEQSPESVVMANVDYRRVESNDRTWIFESDWSIDAHQFDPSVDVQGEGKITYSPRERSVDSLSYSFRITVSKPNRTMTVPIRFSLERLTGDDLTAYQESRQAAIDRANKLKKERQAMENQLPDLDEREAILETFRNGTREQQDLLATKLRNDDGDPDPELAWAIYESLLQTYNPSYTGVQLVKQLDPDLEKSVTVLEKYRSSFDISLTGDRIAPDQPLQRQQLICYPKYSRWSVANFYGSVDEILVLITRERDPKYIAVKREDCRLPIDAFRDPALLDIASDAGESTGDN
ncbi:hypothetical protein FYK55_11365 [Roseiconus nitratireducens]|uniref:Secreted protein n=1 Tax=Roseiconus nitratireducens TaxID=2605748 RepID=A0A5M6D8B0_9BACT|nr:hypothetical protein [Roseiconus nitratireducens]KAA5543771.1 hypothetical protein FYK55_11365 [Roseiconus nitratireducens]